MSELFVQRLQEQHCDALRYLTSFADAGYRLTACGRANFNGSPKTANLRAKEMAALKGPLQNANVELDVLMFKGHKLYEICT